MPVHTFQLTIFVVVVPDPHIRSLYLDMMHTRSKAYRPGTVRNHDTMLRTYVSFCLHFGFQELFPAPSVLCMYIQFLSRTFKSPTSIQNYLAAVTLLHNKAGKPPPPVSYEVQIMLRALKLTSQHFPSSKLPITPVILNQLCDMLDHQATTGLVIKSALLLAFFTFLRQSNLCPTASHTFDNKKHLARGDVFFHHPGMIILIKWSKTLQHGKYALLPVPRMPMHPHCPVSAFKKMFKAIPANSNQPLFILPPPASHTLTVSYLREALKILLSALKVDSSLYSLHSFRRGGATTAYNAGVNFAKVKDHGTWLSDSFWRYVATDLLSPDVPNALAAALQPPNA